MVAHAADTLTAMRLVVAGAIAVALSQGRTTLAAGLLVVGWMTDALDGPLARSTPVPTRLGAVDPLADAALGAGVIVGMILDDRLGSAWLIPPIVLAAVMIGARSEAAGMLLQAFGYAALFWMLGVDSNVQAAAMVFAGIGIVVAIHGRRLMSEMLPKFFADVRRLAGRS